MSRGRPPKWARCGPKKSAPNQNPNCRTNAQKLQEFQNIAEEIERTIERGCMATDKETRQEMNQQLGDQILKIGNSEIGVWQFQKLFVTSNAITKLDAEERFVIDAVFAQAAARQLAGGSGAVDKRHCRGEKPSESDASNENAPVKPST